MSQLEGEGNGMWELLGDGIIIFPVLRGLGLIGCEVVEQMVQPPDLPARLLLSTPPPRVEVWLTPTQPGSTGTPTPGAAFAAARQKGEGGGQISVHPVVRVHPYPHSESEGTLTPGTLRTQGGGGKFFFLEGILHRPPPTTSRGP